LNPIRISSFSESSHEEKKAALNTYMWSSYPDYVASPRYQFLSCDAILSYFNGNRSSYRGFVEEGISGCLSPLEKGKGHGIIGNTAFIKEMLALGKITPSREQPEARRVVSLIAPTKVLTAVACHFHTTQDDIIAKRGPVRAITMDLLFRYAGMNQREIGKLMALDYSTVSVARTRLREAMKKDQILHRHVMELEDALCQ